MRTMFWRQCSGTHVLVEGCSTSHRRSLRRRHRRVTSGVRTADRVGPRTHRRNHPNRSRRANGRGGESLHRRRGETPPGESARGRVRRSAHHVGSEHRVGNAVVGERNPIAPPVVTHRDESGGVWADFVLGAAYEGPPGHVRECRHRSSTTSSARRPVPIGCQDSPAASPCVICGLPGWGRYAPRRSSPKVMAARRSAEDTSPIPTATVEAEGVFITPFCASPRQVNFGVVFTAMEKVIVTLPLTNGAAPVSAIVENCSPRAVSSLHAFSAPPTTLTCSGAWRRWSPAPPHSGANVNIDAVPTSRYLFRNPFRDGRSWAPARDAEHRRPEPGANPDPQSTRSAQCLQRSPLDATSEALLSAANDPDVAVVMITGEAGPSARARISTRCRPASLIRASRSRQARFSRIDRRAQPLSEAADLCGKAESAWASEPRSWDTPILRSCPPRHA